MARATTARDARRIYMDAVKEAKKVEGELYLIADSLEDAFNVAYAKAANIESDKERDRAYRVAENMELAWQALSEIHTDLQKWLRANPVVD